jgi:hypothetical protein
VSAIEHGCAIRSAHLPDLFARIAFHGQLSDLGVQLLDRALPFRLGVRADARIERPAGVLEQLLLPGVDLIRTNLVLPPSRTERDPRFGRRVNLPSRLLGHRPLRLS